MAFGLWKGRSLHNTHHGDDADGNHGDGHRDQADQRQLPTIYECQCDAAQKGGQKVDEHANFLANAIFQFCDVSLSKREFFILYNLHQTTVLNIQFIYNKQGFFIYFVCIL